MTGWVWLAGADGVVPAAEASLPIVTPAVLFGESLFETFRLREGRIFRLDAHLERLRRSLRALGWEGAADPADWVPHALRRLREVASAECIVDGRVRVTLLRGGDGPTEEPPYEAAVWLQPYTPPSPEVYRRGAAAILAADRIDPGAAWGRHKTGNRLIYRLALAEGARKGAREAILCNAAGRVADGATSNPFWVRDGVLYTPSLECGGLPGITRQAVLELAAAEGIAAKQGEYTADSLSEAEELFCTNALIGVLPLTSWNGEPVGSGTPGPYTLRILEAFRREVERRARAV